LFGGGGGEMGSKVAKWMVSYLSWPGGDTDSSGFPVMTLLEHIYNTHTTGGAKVAVPDQELHTRSVTVRFPRVAEFNILRKTKEKLC